MAGKYMPTHRLFRQQLKEVHRGSFWDFLKALVATGSLLFFFLMMMEWGYVSGFYETLGIPPLVKVALESAPGKYGIGVYLVKEAFLISFVFPIGAIIGLLAYKLVPFISSSAKTQIMQGASQLDIVAKIIVTIVVLLSYPLTAVYLEQEAISSLIGLSAQESGVVIFIVAIIMYAIMWLSDRRLGQKWIWVKWSAVLFVVFIFFLFSSVLLFRAGQHDARKFLSGEFSSVGVALSTTHPLPVSPAVDVIQADAWYYYPQEVFSASGMVFSLQYIGKDEENVYLLDYVAHRAIAIPRAEIINMSLLPSGYRQDALPILIGDEISTTIQFTTYSPPLVSPILLPAVSEP